MNVLSSWILREYTVPILKELYSIHFEKFVQNLKLPGSESANPNLDEISVNIENVLENPRYCTAWIKNLPAIVKVTIEKVLFRGQQKISDLELELNINLVRNNGANKVSGELILMPGFYLFKLIQGLNPGLKNPKDNYAIDLSDKLKKILRKSLFLTADPAITEVTRSVKDVDSLDYQTAKKTIGLLTIIKDQSGKTRKQLIKKLAEEQGAEELFKGKEYTENGLHLLTEIVDNKSDLTVDSAPMDLIKFLLEALKNEGCEAKHLIPHVYGTRQKQEYKIKIQKYILKFFRSISRLPEDRWIQEKDFLQYFQKTIQLSFFEGSKTYYHKGKKKIWIDRVNYTDLMVIPLLKNLISFFCLVGILAGNRDNEFRLTSLGAIALKSKDHEGALLTWAEEVKIDLDSDRLLIELSTDDIALQDFIEGFSNQLSRLTYLGDLIKFVAKLRTEEELNFFKDQFKIRVADPLPKIWKVFFREARERIHPLELRDDMVVYQLSEEQKGLAKLLTTDPCFKEIIYRVEDYKIALLKHDLPKLRSRLKQKGYLL